MVIVQKYGGTSVGSIERIEAVADRVLRTVQQGHRVVVVVSAMAGETDRLLRLAQAFVPASQGSPADWQRASRELDVLLASGEQVSIALVALALKQRGADAVSLLGHQVKILTDSAYSRARIRRVDAPRLFAALDEGKIPVVAGFQGIDEGGNLTTLGRGGSDTSAVAVAASLQADVCEIFTDVDGVYTTDPHLCPEARKIARITYDEMMELASLGAKVLQIRSVEVAHKFGVPLHVRSSFSEEEGTMVVADDPESLEQLVVTGVSLDATQSRLTVRSLPWRPGVQAELFAPLGSAGVVVDMIVQSPPMGGKTNISFTVPETDLTRAVDLVRPLAQRHGDGNVLTDNDTAKVSIVGVGMRSYAGVAQRMFELLAAEGIDILMISTSEIKVSCLIPRAAGTRAVRALHVGFGLSAAPDGSAAQSTPAPSNTATTAAKAMR